MNKTWIFLLLLCGCSAAKHLQIADKHIAIAIAKGAKVRVDTVYKDKLVSILIPSKEDSSSLAVEVSDEFAPSIKSYDSLLLLHNITLEAKIKTDNALNFLRAKFSRGFSKDSVYVVRFDSTTTVYINVKGGVLNGVKLKQKERKIMEKQHLPISIDRTIKAGYNVWQMIGSAFSGLVLCAMIVAIIIYIRIRRDQSIKELLGRNI